MSEYRNLNLYNYDCSIFTKFENKMLIINRNLSERSEFAKSMIKLKIKRNLYNSICKSI